MSAYKGVRAKLRAMLRPGRAEADLEDEIRFHIEQETEKLVRRGHPRAEAERMARVAFGGVTRAKESHREVRGLPQLETIASDVRQALRGLARSPALAGAAVLTLALAVGANTAIFSAVNAVILRPLPFPEPERLVMLWEHNPDRGWTQADAAPANVLDWREQVSAFEDVAAYAGFAGQSTLLPDGEPLLVNAAYVTGNLFSVLGVRAMIGRTLTDEETWESDARPFVISHRLWQTRFGGDPSVVGQPIRTAAGAAQIVGVMPPSFSFPWEETDLWMSIGWRREQREQVSFRRAHWTKAVARLEPGVSPEQADVQLQAVVRRLQERYPETNTNMGAGMTPLHRFLVGDTRLPLLVLLGAVSLLLLIACANIGNLLLVQASSRERETSLRIALGARRGRLVRQALTESLVLSAIGGAAGLALGWAGTKALAALQPAGMLRVREFGMDARVLGFVLAITTASGLLFGLAPSLWSGRRQPADALREGSRTGSDGRRMRRWGDLLVTAEVALALLLTVGAGLLLRSFVELQRVPPGFDPEGVMTAGVAVGGARYDSAAKIVRFHDELLRRARALPGVSDAALVRKLPLTDPSWSSDFIAFGRPVGAHGTEVVHREISPGYFRTMRVPLLKGRDFTEDDRLESPLVVIVNESLARSYFGSEDPIGQRIAFDRVPDSTSQWRTIVGVVGDEHQTSLGTPPRIEIFAPVAQDVTNGVVVVARTSGEPDALAPAIRRIVAELDPELAIRSIDPMTAVASRSLAMQRFLMTLFLAFAGVGVALAVVGVYGVLAQVTRRRIREMGIRIALGAPVAQVRWLVVRHGLRLTLTGLVVGAALALFAAQAMTKLLFRVPATDPATFAGVAAIIAVTGVLASWLPARRASGADPVAALRGD